MASERGGEMLYATSGSVELGVGAEYGKLGMAGFLGTIPLATWVGVVLSRWSPLGTSEFGSSAANGLVGGLVIAATLALLLVAPWLSPCLVLRARQPRGARVEWNEHFVTEWEGEWRKTAIAWEDVAAAHVRWATTVRGKIIHDEALQLFGPEGAVITLWTSRPSGVPPVRRRVCTRDVGQLRQAIQKRDIALSRKPDWKLAFDADRPPHPTHSAIGRIGYPLAVLAPLLAPSAVGTAGAVAAVAAVLLTIRALPSFREARAILARRTASRRAVASGGVAKTNPYRAAAERLPASDEAAQALVEGLKLRAVLAEALLRAACVATVVTTTALASGPLP